MAANGQEGILKAKSEQPTLIMCDMIMPGMNGMQVLDTLKTDESTKKIPVVMLTNMAADEDVKAALDKGAVKYIVKSNMDPQQLMDAVREVLMVVSPK
jgi:CheY-like chemotaxis protein